MANSKAEQKKIDARKMLVEKVNDMVEALEDGRADEIESLYDLAVDEMGAGHETSRRSTEIVALRITAQMVRGGHEPEILELRATSLPVDVKSVHDRLVERLKANKHAKPAMFWMRARAKAKAMLIEVLGDEAGAGETAQEKLRRLTEESIQGMYSRISRAVLNPEVGVDSDILGLLGDLRDMASAIKMVLVEPGTNE